MKFKERIAKWLLQKTHYFNVENGDFTRYTVK